MIVEYHRPKTIEDALYLLSRKEPNTIPLGGGTILSRHSPVDCAVVDLQSLGLNQIEQRGEIAQVGATVTLQQLADASYFAAALIQATEREGSYNHRQMATLGGMLVAGDGRSPLLTALLALDAELRWLPGEGWVRLGEWLPLRDDRKHGFIDQVRFPVNVRLGYDQIGRSPADIAIISVAVAKWPSGRIRIVVGGDMPLPVLAADGAEQEGIELAGQIAHSHFHYIKYPKKYIQNATTVLIQRLLSAFKG